jgi:hypothetical protein
MDKLSIKKGLFAGMGDFARQMRMEQLRKKYAKGGLSNEMAEVAAGGDNAVEESKLPDTKNDAAFAKKPGVAVTITSGMGEVADDADKWADENQAAMDEMADDIEKKKLSRMYGEK